MFSFPPLPPSPGPDDDPCLQQPRIPGSIGVAGQVLTAVLSSQQETGLARAGEGGLQYGPVRGGGPGGRVAVATLSVGVCRPLVSEHSVWGRNAPPSEVAQQLTDGVDDLGVLQPVGHSSSVPSNEHVEHPLLAVGNIETHHRLVPLLGQLDSLQLFLGPGWINVTSMINIISMIA